MVVGGFAVNYHGYIRATMDIDLLVDSSKSNQAKVKKSLEVLADKAVLEIADDDLNDYLVIRVGDEITVDLMAAACGQGLIVTRTKLLEDAPVPQIPAPVFLAALKENAQRHNPLV